MKGLEQLSGGVDALSRLGGSEIRPVHCSSRLCVYAHAGACAVWRMSLLHCDYLLQGV